MTDRIEFQTKRLLVQDWNEQLQKDQRLLLAEALKSVLTPPVLKHLPQPLQLESGENSLEDWIKARAAESDVLTIYSRDKSSLLGLIILAEIPETDKPTTIHLGYLLAENAWGRGYATELIAGLIGWYRDQHQPVMLIGGVNLENSASARVLLKNGFEIVPEASGRSTQMYSLEI